MKIARVFPRKTTATPDDDLVFFGPPPDGIEVDEIHISQTFTYDNKKVNRLYSCWEHIAPIKIGYPKDTFIDAEKRLLQAWKAGFLPMAMLWKNFTGDQSPKWRKFQRLWARPALTKSIVKDSYQASLRDRINLEILEAR